MPDGLPLDLYLSMREHQDREYREIERAQKSRTKRAGR